MNFRPDSLENQLSKMSIGYAKSNINREQSSNQTSPEIPPGVSIQGNIFFISLPDKDICHFFNLVQVYKELSKHQSVENLIDEVYVNHEYGRIELNSKPYIL